MKEIPITKGYIALVDDEDYERISAVKWSANLERYGGRIGQVYAVRHLRDGANRSFAWMHRVILGLDDKALQVDHVNHNGLDNRRENLRICTGTQNQGNRVRGCNNKSGVKGVSWCKRKHKWQASVQANKKRVHLGYFSRRDAAAAAYLAAAQAVFGDFAHAGDVGSCLRR